MKKIKLSFVLLMIALPLGVGCAASYNSSPGCYVDCKYCVPPPLPYTKYEGHACHSCAASRYLTTQPPAVERENDDAPNDDAASE